MKLRNEVKIGIVTLLALVLGYLGLNFLKGINVFVPENRYKVRLRNLNGTAVATPVLISGYKVGSVQKIDFAYDPQEGYGADLTLGLDPNVQIPKGSTIKVRTNMLSGAELLITAPQGASQSFLSSGDRIEVEGGDDIMAKVNDQILPEVMKMLPEAMAMLKRLNQVMNNPAIDSTLTNFNQATRQMQLTLSKVYESMQVMPELVHNVNALSKSLAVLGRKAEQISLDSILINLNASTSNLKYISEQLQASEGTAGKLLNDPSLYNRLDSLAMNAEMLIKDLKQNPKRYVHFSIFGRKN